MEMDRKSLMRIRFFVKANKWMSILMIFGNFWNMSIVAITPSAGRDEHFAGILLVNSFVSIGLWAIFASLNRGLLSFREEKRQALLIVIFLLLLEVFIMAVLEYVVLKNTIFTLNIISTPFFVYLIVNAYYFSRPEVKIQFEEKGRPIS